jgi:hypothetical protein
LAAVSLGQQLRVVDHLVVAAVLAVLLAQGVQAVRAGGDDALGLVAHHLVERLDVALGQLEEERLVAGAAGRVAGAAFHLAQHGIVDAGGVENLGKGAGRLLRARVIGGRAAHPPEHLEVRVVVHRGHFHITGPLHAVARAEVPRVAVALHAP